jgi:hypothetical protein
MRDERHERRRSEGRAELSKRAGLANDQVQILEKTVDDFNEDLRRALGDVPRSGGPADEAAVERVFESLRAVNQAAAERTQRIAPGLEEGDIMAFLGYQMDWLSVERLAAFHQLHGVRLEDELAATAGVRLPKLK